MLVLGYSRSSAAVHRCLVFGISLLLAGVAHTAEPAHFRPSRSEPAFRVDQGDIEFELGVSSVSNRLGSNQTRTSTTPMQLRYGIADAWMVQLTSDGYVDIRETGVERLRGLGSSSIALRHTLPLADTLWASIAAGTTLPTASPVFRSFHNDPFAQLAVTWFGPRLRLTGIAAIGRHAESSEGPGQIPTRVASVTLASFLDLSRDIGLAADVNLDRLRGQGEQYSWVVGVVWRARPAMLVDIGLGSGHGTLGSHRTLTAGVVFQFNESSGTR